VIIGAVNAAVHVGLLPTLGALGEVPTVGRQLDSAIVNRQIRLIQSCHR